MEPVGPRAALEQEVMPRLAPLLQLIAGGAAALPLLAFGHGSEFLDAKFFFDRAGVAHLEITADYGGNPMLANAEEAKAALIDALRIICNDEEHKLSDLAPLKIEPRAQPDPESPAPRGPEDAQTKQQLLTARWQWQPSATALRFFVPKDSMHTTLFWMREPDVHPPRWSMLIAADRTPAIPVPPRASLWPWFAALLLPLSWWSWRRRSHSVLPAAQEDQV